MTTTTSVNGGEPPREAQKRQATASVRLENVTKRFGNVRAVDRLTLDIAPGEFFTLLGPSGCGKTTTLRMVAGFERPSEGRILLDGADVSDLPAYRRPTNTVFQSYALFPHMSVEDNVAFGLRRRGVARDEVRRRVAHELERVGLAREARRRPRELSGGQQQRVALARALVNLPTVLLLDEPLGALDLKLRKGLQVELKRIQRDVGITFVYVTHDQEEALTMSDRLAVMNHGRIEQVDAPESVYERPGTPFVAGFIGVSNLMPGQVVRLDGEGADIRLDAGPSLHAPRAAAGLRAGARCFAVVRPEKLDVARADASGGAAGTEVEGLVESALYLGTAIQMSVRIPGDVVMTALVPNRGEDRRRLLPGAGERVRLSWAPEHIHVLSGEGEQRAEETGSLPPPARVV